MVVDLKNIPLSMDAARDKKQRTCGLYSNYKVLTPEETNNYKLNFSKENKQDITEREL